MTEQNAFLFLSGAEMDPSAVLAAYPGARFIARARVRAQQHEIATPFAHGLVEDGTGVVWGILIERSGEQGGETRQAITDEGREIDAVVGGQLASGGPDAVLAAAKYWELPPAYVGRLREAIGAVEEEPPR
jgi:fermentation-respiration switch protein FrsA (DUF1100 family)